MFSTRTFFLLLTLGAGVLAGCAGARGAAETAASRAAADPQALATFDGGVITRAEFEQKYAKSVGGRAEAIGDSVGAYREFLDRYLNFRLKVKAGEAAGYRRDSTIQSEIAAYETNLARPFLLDQQVIEPLIRQMYERMQENVDASHILIRVEPTASPADTLRAYNRLAALLDSVRAGADFGTLALRYSEDPSAKNLGGLGYKGRLGFFGPGQMVGEFEEAAYNTPVGSVSPIIRTQFGYHALYVHERKPAVPEVWAAHIMIAPEEGDTTRALARIDSIRTAILAGADFGEMVRRHSMHQATVDRGGVVGPLSYNAFGQVPESFKNAAFALKNVGDLSEVVRTDYGYHVLQLTRRRDLTNYNAVREELRPVAAQLPQARQAEARLAQSVRQNLGARLDSSVVRRAVAAAGPDSARGFYLAGALPRDAYAQTFAALGDSVYTLGDLAAYLRETEAVRRGDDAGQALAAADAFLNDRAIAHKARTLEAENPEFKTLLDEFRDGLVLFKLMEEEVWNAAPADSAGVRAYYEAHAASFRFPDRTRVITFASTSDSLLARAVSELKSGATPTDIGRLEMNGARKFTITVDTVYVSGPTGGAFDKALGLPVGGIVGPMIDQSRFVVLLNDGAEPARPKTFEEARPEATAAYQQVLEERLVERLRARYHARTFPERLAEVFRDAAPQTAGMP